MSDFIGPVKYSALSKAKIVNQYVNEMTLGLESVKIEEKKPTPVKVQKASNTIIPCNDSLLTTYSPFKKALNDWEADCNIKVQDAISRRRKHMQDFEKGQALISNQKWQESQQESMRKVQQQEGDIFRALQEHHADSLKNQAKQREFYKGLAERRKQVNKAIKEKEARQREMVLALDRIVKSQQGFRLLYNEVLETLRSNYGVFKQSDELIQGLNRTAVEILEVVEKCKNNCVTLDDADKVDKLVIIAKNIQNKINKTIKDKQDEEEDEIDLLKIQQEEKEALGIIQPNAVEESSVKTKESNSLMKTCSEPNKVYIELLEFLNKYEANFTDLKHPTLKSFIFDCKKAVNVPVNTISAVNRAHLLDKYQKLFNLLSGKAVGEANFIASKHPQGIAYSMYFLAKKLILQADVMISSNPEAAFSYAVVILSLWNDFPEFGKLMLAQFYKECPYLAPVYIEKQSSQSDESYYKSIGYQYIDGVIEKQDKYLKRMTGIMRLYASLLISYPKQSQNKHPHDISNGWRWLTSVLNQQPRLDITATLIFSFFEIAGSTMQRVYQQQFTKLLNFTLKVYIPLVKKCDSGGPASRLEILLEDYMKNRNFEEPIGLLPRNFC